MFLAITMAIVLYDVKGASASPLITNQNQIQDDSSLLEQEQLIDLTNLTQEKINELNNKYSEFTIIPKYSNDLLVESSEGDIIRPMAIEIRLDKPIAGWGFIPNHRFYEVIQAYERDSNFLQVLDNVLLLRISSTTLDIAQILTGAVAGWGIHPFTQYLNTGTDYYAVSVYASGVSPSLSTIQYRYFSAAPLTFTYY